MIIQNIGKNRATQFVEDDDPTKRRKVNSAFLEGIQGKPLRISSVPNVSQPSPIDNRSNLDKIARLLVDPNVARPLNDFANALVGGDQNTFGGALANANSQRFELNKSLGENQRFSEVIEALGDSTSFEGISLDGLSPDQVTAAARFLEANKSRAQNEKTVDKQLGAQERIAGARNAVEKDRNRIIEENNEGRLEIAKKELQLQRDKLNFQLEAAQAAQAGDRAFTPAAFGRSVRTAAAIPVVDQGVDLINNIISSNLSLRGSQKEDLRRALNNLAVAFDGTETEGSFDANITTIIRQLNAAKPADLSIKENKLLADKIDDFRTKLATLPSFMTALQDMFANPNKKVSNADLIQAASSFALTDDDLVKQAQRIGNFSSENRQATLNSVNAINTAVRDILLSKVPNDQKSRTAAEETLDSSLIITGPIDLTEFISNNQSEDSGIRITSRAKFVLNNGKVVGIIPR